MENRSGPLEEGEGKSAKNPDNENLAIEVLQSPRTGHPSSSPGSAANTAAFDGQNPPTVGIQDSSKAPKAEQPSQKILSETEQNKLLAEADQLSDKGENPARQIEIFSTVARSSDHSGLWGGKTQADQYYGRAIEIGEKNSADPQIMRDLYKEQAQFYLHNKSKLNDLHEPIVDQAAVAKYLDKAIDSSNKMFKQLGDRNAVPHIELLEYKAGLHLNFGGRKNQEEAIDAYMTARHMRDEYKIPESKESLLAMKTCCDTFKRVTNVDPVKGYLRTLEIAAKLPEKESGGLQPYVNNYVDLLKRSKPNSNHDGNHQEIVDKLKHVVDIGQKTYGDADPRLLPILQKVASICTTNLQMPSSIKAKYAVDVLEKIASMQNGKDPAERLSTMTQLGNEYYVVGDHTASMATLSKALTEAGTVYGKDDPRMVPILSGMANEFSRRGDYGQSINFLERINKLQSAPGSKVPVEERLDTLLRIGDKSLYGKGGSAAKAIENIQQAVALAEKSYPKDDVRYEDFLRKAITEFKSSSLHEQNASLLEKLYNTQTSKNKPIEERLKTLQDLSQEYLAGSNYKKGAQAYTQIIEMVKPNKDLHSFLALPESMQTAMRVGPRNASRDKANPPSEIALADGLYDLGKAVKAGGDILTADGSHNKAFVNYQSALESFGHSVSRGTEVKSAALLDMLNLGNVELRLENHNDIKDPDLQESQNQRDQEQRREFKEGVKTFYQSASESVVKQKSSNDAKVLDVIDKLNKFFEEEQDTRHTLPLYARALEIAKVQKRGLEEIGDRSIKLSFVQSIAGDKEAAMKTGKELLKYAKDASGEKPNLISMRALEHLSYLSKQTADGKQAPEGRRENLKEALEFKKQQVDMAKALKGPGPDIAKALDEQSEFQSMLGDKTAALSSMQEALKADPNALRSPDFMNRLRHLYENSNQVDKVEGLLRKSIELKRQNDPYDTLVFTTIDLATLLKTQGKVKEAEKTLDEIVKPLQDLAKGFRDKGNFEQAYNKDRKLAAVLEWLGPHYEEQKDWPKAEKNYLLLSETIKNLPSPISGKNAELKNSLTGLLRAYKAQDKKQDAFEIEEDIKELDN